MKYKFIVHGWLPGLNEILGAANANRYVGAKLKKSTQDVVAWEIRNQLKSLRIKKPVFLHYAYYEPNRKRDKDNISGGAHKIVQDALVQTGVLHNDGWSYIAGSSDLVYEVDKASPRVEVEIEEVENES